MPTIQELAAQNAERKRAGQESRKEMAAALIPGLQALQAVYESPELAAIVVKLEEACANLEGAEMNSVIQTSNIIRHLKMGGDTVAAELTQQQNITAQIIR